MGKNPLGVFRPGCGMQVLWGYIDPIVLDYLKERPGRKTNIMVGSRKSLVIITSIGFMLDVHIYKGKPMSLQNWVVGGKSNSNFTILDNLLSSSLIILILLNIPKLHLHGMNNIIVL